MKKGVLGFQMGLFFLAILSFIFSGAAFAQEKFPGRPISFISPWAAGGSGPVDAQTLQPGFEKAIGVAMVPVFKAGGGGTIAWNYVVNSSPDGYTMGIINPSTLVTPYTTKTGVRYDKFDLIIMTGILSTGLVVRADSPWKTFQEFVDYAKANPGKVQMGNSGHAAMFHIASIGVEMAANIKFTHIPFKGVAPCLTAMLGGHVDATYTQLSTILPYVEAKRIRILAVSSPKRLAILPNVPTFNEKVLDDLFTWYIYVVPKGTPKDRIKILHDALKAGKDSEGYQAYYNSQGGAVADLEVKDLPIFLNNQEIIWKKLIDFGGFKPE